MSLLAVLSIHHVKCSSKVVATQREVHTLKMKLQEIMKGEVIIINTKLLNLVVGSNYVYDVNY